MTEPKDIPALVEKLMDNYEVRTILTESRLKNMHDVYEHFPSIASLCLEQAKEIERLRGIPDNDELLEVGRKAVEDVLVDFRDSRISQFLRGNGLVIKEKDGKDSSIIRLGTEDAISIGLKAILKHLSHSSYDN